MSGCVICDEIHTKSNTVIVSGNSVKGKNRFSIIGFLKVEEGVRTLRQALKRRHLWFLAQLVVYVCIY